jgi:FkbM family methyltransferase
LSERDPLADYLHVGLSDSEGELTLHTPIYRGIPIHTHTSSSLDYLQTALARDFSPGVVSRITYRSDTVRVVTGDSLVLEPDIIKIDVEGHDFEVLKGLGRTVERHRPAIMVEFTPQHTDELDQWALALDYVPAVFDRGRDAFTRFDRGIQTTAWHSTGLQVNIFLIPAERCSRRQGLGVIALA